MAHLGILLISTLLPWLTFAQQRQLTCAGDIHFFVLDKFDRNDRDYYFHGYVSGVQECVKTCFASEFCFSAGFQPGISGNNSCLLSYKSAYGCSFRSLITAYADNSKEVVIECIRCPAAGEIITPAPTPQIGILSGGNETEISQSSSTATQIPTTTSLVSSANETTPSAPGSTQIGANETSSTLSSTQSGSTETTSAQSSSLSTQTTPNETVSAQTPTLLTTVITGSVAVTQESPTTGSTSPGPTVSIAQTTAGVTGVSETSVTGGANIEGTVSTIPLRDACAGTLTYEVLLPKETDKSNTDFYAHERVEGVDSCAQLCFQTSGCASVGYVPTDKKSGVCLLAKEKKDQICQPSAKRQTGYQATEPIDIDCIQCGANVTGSPAIDVTVETATKLSETSVVPGQNVSSITATSATVTSVSGENVTAGNSTIAFTTSLPTTENVTAQTNSIGSIAPGSLEANVETTTSTAQLSTTNSTVVTSAQYNTAETQLPITSNTPNLPTESTTSGSQTTSPSGETTTVASGCQLNFRVTLVARVNGFVDHSMVKTAQQCAQECHSRPDCDVAGFLPGANGDNSAACFFTRGLSGNCSEETTGKFDNDYKGDQPVTISCITCGKETEANVTTSTGIPTSTKVPEVSTVSISGELRIDANVTSFSKSPEVQTVTQSSVVNETSTTTTTTPAASSASSNVTNERGVRKVCAGDLKFLAITPTGDKSKTEYIDDMEVKSASECAKICYSKPDCSVAGFSPIGPDRHSCILSRDAKAECPDWSAKLLVDYTDSAPMHLQCFTCA